MGVFNFLFGLIAGGVTKREYGSNTWNPPPKSQPLPPADQDTDSDTVQTPSTQKER